MSSQRKTHEPSERRQVVVLLRLVVDTGDRLIYGELIDADGRTQKKFREWQTVPTAIRTWLAGGENGDQE